MWMTLHILQTQTAPGLFLSFPIPHASKTLPPPHAAWVGSLLQLAAAAAAAAAAAVLAELRPA